MSPGAPAPASPPLGEATLGVRLRRGGQHYSTHDETAAVPHPYAFYPSLPDSTPRSPAAEEPSSPHWAGERNSLQRLNRAGHSDMDSLNDTVDDMRNKLAMAKLRGKESYKQIVRYELEGTIRIRSKPGTRLFLSTLVKQYSALS